MTSVIFNKNVKDINAKFDTTTRHKSNFSRLQATHVQDFLLAIPIDGLGQHMSHINYCTILKYHLMIFLFLVVSHVYSKVYLDILGEHVIHCNELSDITLLRMYYLIYFDFDRDVLFDMQISTKK